MSDEEAPEEVQKFQPGATWRRHRCGGWVSNTARVEETVFVGRRAVVYDRARVLDNAQIGGAALVYEDAVVCADAVVVEHAVVCGHAMVCGNAMVGGHERVGVPDGFRLLGLEPPAPAGEAKPCPCCASSKTPGRYFGFDFVTSVCLTCNGTVEVPS